MNTGPGLLALIGDYVADLRYEAIPEIALAPLRICLDFNLGIARAGFPLVSDVAAPYSRAVSGQATLWTGGGTGPTERIAAANSMATHARSQDDFTHVAASHIGAVATSAAIALAEEKGTTGQELLVALTAAYQVAGVLGRAGSGASGQRGFRGTPLYSPLGAAAACARLLGGDATQIANAVGLAANAAGGFNQTWLEGRSEWWIQPGTAAENAIRSARLAVLGAQASPFALEGPAGFFRAYAGIDVEVTELGEALQREWLISATRLKRLPVCGLNQGPAATARHLTRQLPATASPTRVRLEMRPEEIGYPGMSERGPFDGPGAALMSAPYVVSTALLTGDVAFAALERPADPRVPVLAAEMELVENATLPPLGHVLTVTDNEGMEHRFVGATPNDEVTAEVRDEILREVAHQTGDPLVLNSARTAAVAGLADARDVSGLVAAI